MTRTNEGGLLPHDAVVCPVNRTADGSRSNENQLTTVAYVQDGADKFVATVRDGSGAEWTVLDIVNMREERSVWCCHCGAGRPCVHSRHVGAERDHGAPCTYRQAAAARAEQRGPLFPSALAYEFSPVAKWPLLDAVRARHTALGDCAGFAAQQLDLKGRPISPADAGRAATAQFETDRAAGLWERVLQWDDIPAEWQAAYVWEADRAEAGEKQGAAGGRPGSPGPGN